MYKKGFTLIELLVVIAIIGILSGVVLSSLNSARGKASDAAVKANLANIRAQAEIYYDTNDNSYATVCTADGGIGAGWAAAKSAGGKLGDCNSDANHWAATANLKSAAGTYWCVDDTGTSTSRGSDIGADAVSCQ